MSGVDNRGNPFIQYTVTWHYQQLLKRNGGEEIEDVGNTETGDIASAIFYSTTGEKISDAMSCTLEYGATASVSCIDKSNIFTPYIFKETKDSNGDDFWEATITILVGKEAKHSFVGSTTSVDNEYIGGRFTPLSVDISFYGDVYTVSFEEVDASSANIENATTTVSVPTSELMQGFGYVKIVRDNILSDYANGVPTATVDVFCGLGDWKNGEVIKPNEIVTFDDDIDDNGDKNYWRVTGRTFKYQGAPTLSLELQQQKKWHTLWKWTGSVKKDDIWDESGSGNNETGMIDLPVTVDDPSNTLIAAKITFMENGVEKTHNISGIRVARTSIGVGEIAEVECWISIRSNGAEVDYFAGYQQIQQGGETLTGYVKSIEITQLTTAEFY